MIEKKTTKEYIGRGNKKPSISNIKTELKNAVLDGMLAEIKSIEKGKLIIKYINSKQVRKKCIHCGRL